MGAGKMLIWGAGRIGRGFVADLFQQAKYQLSFVDADSALVQGLKDAGKYTVLRITGKDQTSSTVIVRSQTPLQI